MSRIAAVVALGGLMLGCGRLGFDATGGDAGFDAAIDDALPMERFRTIGSGGELHRGQGMAVAGSRLVSFDAVLPKAVGAGDRVRARGEDAFIFERISDSEIVLERPLTEDAGIELVIERAFDSLEAWESARQGDLVTEQRREIGLVTNDAVLVFTATGRALTISGSQTSAEYYMELRAQAPHRGAFGVGSILDGEGDLANGIVIEDDFARLVGLELRDFYVLGDGGSTAVLVRAKSVTLDRLLVHRTVDDNSGSLIRDSPAPQPPADYTVSNSMLFRTRDAVRTNQGDTLVAVVNSTIHDVQSGIIDTGNGNSTAIVRNTIVSGCALVCIEDIYTQQLANITSDASAVGLGSQGGVDAAAIYLSATGPMPDLHLSDSSPARSAGMAEALEFDVDGDRRPLGDWDIGADEVD